MLKWIRNTLRLARAAQECRLYEEEYYRIRRLYDAHPTVAWKKELRRANGARAAARLRLAAAREACK